MAKKEEKTTLEETIKALEKKFGKNTILTLEKASDDNYEVFNTGSIGFDYAVLGIGGFAKGKVYELMGWESVGKSTVCGHAVANCQKQNGTVLYIDGEHSVDKKYFKKLGVDIEKMLLAQPTTGEEGFKIVLDMMATGEIDLIVIDSDSSLIPKAVLDGEPGDHNIGKKAKLNSNNYPRIKSLSHKTNTTVLVVSQYREKMTLYGDPKTTQGGHALKYYSDVRIEISRKLNKEGTKTVASDTKVKTIKNKTFSPFIETRFYIFFETQTGFGIDKYSELMQLIHDYKVGKKWGNTLTIDDVKYELEEFEQNLREQPEFFEQIKERVIDSIIADNVNTKEIEVNETK